MEKGRAMETTFERRLADLGWQGVPLPTVMVEMCSLFVSAGFDAQAVRRRIEGAGADGSSPMADSRCVVGAFLDQADREGRIEALARPGSRDLPEALAALERLRGDA
jgi:hypothetical protein